ncbi:DUF2752 domain-containing protein [Mesonia sp. HuA40]|uniref:DUF2752 domain-containing protein n=1 Tax=Mesonia sp. HuA40 TaxID=2602761 RepID=UPI00164F1CCB
MEDYLLTCYTKKFFAFPCPGCGGQRAVLLLSEGNLKESFLMYPGLYPLLIFLLLLLVNRIYPFKNYHKWITPLAFLTTITIVVSYGYKLYHLYF